jgi:hypothetical protein
MTAEQTFAILMARCRGGFENEFEWRNWWRKHAAEIQCAAAEHGRPGFGIAWEHAAAQISSG